MTNKNKYINFADFDDDSKIKYLTKSEKNKIRKINEACNILIRMRKLTEYYLPHITKLCSDISIYDESFPKELMQFKSYYSSDKQLYAFFDNLEDSDKVVYIKYMSSQITNDIEIIIYAMKLSSVFHTTDILNIYQDKNYEKNINNISDDDKLNIYEIVKSNNFPLIDKLHKIIVLSDDLEM